MVKLVGRIVDSIFEYDPILANKLIITLLPCITNRRWNGAEKVRRHQCLEGNLVETKHK